MYGKGISRNTYGGRRNTECAAAVSYTHLDVYKRQVHMYNAVVNEWKDVEHQITFDVRQPKTHEYTMKRLRKFIEATTIESSVASTLSHRAYLP